MAALSEVRFDCTSCGKCCTFTGPRQYVFVSIREASRIVAHTGLTWDEATERDPQGRLSLRCNVTPAGGACRFLVDNRCSVYEVRPRQCRAYPFFPGIAESAETWDAERQRCEGIGQGPIIPVEEVTRRLKAAGLRDRGKVSASSNSRTTA